MKNPIRQPPPGTDLQSVDEVASEGVVLKWVYFSEREEGPAHAQDLERQQDT